SNEEVVLGARPYVVAASQELRNLPLCHYSVLGRGRAYKNETGDESIWCTLQVSLICSERNEDSVVQVLAHGRLALGRQHTYHLEWSTIDANSVSERIGLRAVEFFGDCMAQHDDLAGGLDVGRNQSSSAGQRPSSNLEILRRSTGNQGGPIAVRGD